MHGVILHRGFDARKLCPHRRNRRLRQLRDARASLCKASVWRGLFNGNCDSDANWTRSIGDWWRSAWRYQSIVSSSLRSYWMGNGKRIEKSATTLCGTLFMFEMRWVCHSLFMGQANRIATVKQ
jgi:hypothetical protein